MRNDLYLTTEAAKKLYAKASALPIVDYHCHLSPKEIYENVPFETITQIWLGGDHYKWRLMRASGVEEKYITGDADPKDKFIAYAACLEMSPGNPLYLWSHMELKMFFGIDETLTKDNAAEIYEKANAYIKKTRMSPRKLMKASNVELVATTDDPADSLEWHKKIADDPAFNIKVVPSFRPDAAVSILAPEWKEYVARLGEAAGIKTTSLAGFKAALSRRLDFFAENGCRITDIGIADFPKRHMGLEPGDTYRKALNGEPISRAEYENFLFEIYVYLAAKYKRHNMTMQLHLNVKRNASSKLFLAVGKDAGGDTISSSVPVEDVIDLLDACQRVDALPKTLLYTLNPDVTVSYAIAAATFPGVRLGAAWWFNDHTRGIQEVLKAYSETSSIATFPGMLTDSRSFLSYARHDYFRRIFCGYIGEMLESGELLSESAAETIVERVTVENSRAMFA